jgi:hypothetical protein
MRARLIVPAVAVALAAAVSNSAAQQADPRLSEERQPVGWSITPRLTAGAAYDDNVLVQGTTTGDPASDLNTSVTPGGTLDYIGKRTSFNASYSGAVQLYRDFTTLNSYDQSMNVSGRHLLTRHTLIFAQQSYSITPTTEVPAIVGVPFLRVGARIADFRGGLEATPAKHLSVSASYNFNWIEFNKDPVLGVSLLGGHSNGGAAGLKYQTSDRMMLTADYDIQVADVIDGSSFNVQNWWAGVDYRLTENSRAYGALGISRLYAEDVLPGKTSPAWRAGFSHSFEDVAFTVSYAKSFIASYGGGGTLSNQEIVSSVHVPLGRRMYTNGTFSVRSDEPILATEPPLKSMWVSGVLGYAVHPWLHVEGFYGGTHQSIDRPGGRLNRNRIGVQLTTAKPLRIR